MLHRIREARKNESGFTLIELLIVIVILGVLAGIVVFAVSGISDNGTKSACKSDLKSVEVAGEAYYAQKGSYAAAIGDLSPGFLHSVPTDVTYTVAADGKSFTVVGKDGTGATPKGNNCAGVTL
jgi:general secretion pathway protein G